MEYILYNMLSPAELCKCGLYAQANKKFFEIVRSRVNPDLLLKIEEIGAFISGSFILQCFYDVIWQRSDIDIYEFVNTTDHVFSELENYMYHDCGYTESRLGFNYSEFDPEMRIVQTCKYIGSNYEIVTVLNCDKYDFVKRVFDIDICKNILYVHDGKLRLYMYSLYDIMFKTSTVTFKRNQTSTLDRIQKYNARNITLIIKPAHVEPVFTVQLMIPPPIGYTYCSTDDRLAAYSPPSISFRRELWYARRIAIDGVYSLPDVCRCHVSIKPHVHLRRNSDYNIMREIMDTILLEGVD